MKNFFQNLIWPAIAGNVLWGFFSVVLNEKISDSGVIERTAALLVLFIYLAYDWIETSRVITKLKEMYWIGDAFHACAIITFAIAAQSKSIYLNEFLSSVFVIAALFHLIGIWEPKQGFAPSWTDRLILAGINITGIAIIYLFPQLLAWNLAVSILCVTILWIITRKKIYKV